MSDRPTKVTQTASHWGVYRVETEVERFDDPPPVTAFDPPPTAARDRGALAP
jgi:hypothetical protein